VQSLSECEAYLKKVGLATVLPGKQALLPCLLWAAQGHQGPFRGDDPAFQNTWTWKDQLPEQKLAWAGRLWGHQVCLVHLDLLPLALGARGPLEPEELYQEGLLDRSAWQLHQLLEGQSQARGRKWLRQQLGWTDKAGATQFEKACLALERKLLLTRAGSCPTASGWESNSYRLVSQHFEGLEPLPHRQARQQFGAALEKAAPQASPDQLKKWLNAL
jgi:hypothetical protein